MSEISLAHLQQKLERLPSRIQGRPLAKSIRRALGPVVSPIRNALPRDSGELSRAVTVRVARRRGFSPAGGRFAGMIGRIGFRFPQGAHANLMELGTHNADGSVRIRAGHYVRNVYRAHEDRVFEKFSSELLSELGREFKRL